MTTEMKARDTVVSFVSILLVLPYVCVFTISAFGVALKKG